MDGLIIFGLGRGDVVQVDSWVAASGKNGMRRDWLLRDSNTGQTLTRATRLGFLWMNVYINTTYF